MTTTITTKGNKSIITADWKSQFSLLLAFYDFVWQLNAEYLITILYFDFLAGSLGWIILGRAVFGGKGQRGADFQEQISGV